LYGYYHEFGIEINNYISSPEIILSFLPTILLVSGILYGVLFQTFLNSEAKQISIVATDEIEIQEISTLNSKFPIKSKSFLYRMFLKPTTWYFLSSIILALFSYFLVKFFNFKNWELQYWNLITSFIILGCLFAIAYLEKGVSWIQSNKILVLAILIYVLSSMIKEYRKSDAKKIKDGIATTHVKFQRKGKTVETNNFFLYVGETQSKIFFFDRRNKSTIIYKQDEIDSLAIHNP